MEAKQSLLATIREGLRAGIISEADVASLLVSQRATARTAMHEQTRSSKPLAAVDVMFYVAGVILFSAMMSAVAQTPDSLFIHIVLSTVAGVALWLLAYFLIRGKFQSDIRRGVTNALLLTGSLLMIAGGYIVMDELIVSTFDPALALLIGSAILAMLGGFHIGFDMYVRRNVVLLMGVLLAVAAFPFLVVGLLSIGNFPIDLMAVVMIISSGLLAYATRVVVKIAPGRRSVRDSFDSLAGFVALMTMYTASYGDYGPVWLGVLIGAILGAFYMSIRLRSRRLLGTGSFFMVLAIITISFKYFSGFGMTVSLIIAAIGLLGSAAVASVISKRYLS